MFLSPFLNSFLILGNITSHSSNSKYTTSLFFHWICLEIATVDLKGEGIADGEGHLFNLPSKHLEVFAFFLLQGIPQKMQAVWQ